ncbi:MAG: Gfo/Idh/MocA family protein [Planctomycetota bacterium]
MVRLAIVGIGGYGRMLIDAIRTVGEEMDVSLVAAAEMNLARSAEQADRLGEEGVELFEDAEKMFSAMRGKCEAVYIASSIDTHAPLTIAAAEAGLHVHLEKPPAATIEEVDRMQEALQRTGRMCLVGFHQIHGAETRRLKQRLGEGRLGAVRTLACRAGWPRTRSYYQRNDWAGRLRRGDRWVLDGPATNALAHQINNMLYAASTDARGYADPISVRAELYAAGPIESHDTAAIEIRTQQGATAYWLGSHCSEGQFGPIIEIEAERARVLWKPSASLQIDYEDGTSETFTGGGERVDMVRNFVAAVQADDGSRLRCTMTDARKFVLALDGAHESSGRIHRIPSERTHLVDEGTDRERTVVDGLDKLLARAAGAPCLLSDLDGAPDWVVPGEPFDLTGYTAFGRRFIA